MKTTILKDDYFQLFLVLLFGFVAVYLSTPVINQIFFLSLLLLVWRSEKDYFWFAVFFILISSPGSLFFGSAITETKRLPLYTITPGFSFSIFDLFLIITLIKSLQKAKPNPMILRKTFIFLGVFYILVTIYSLSLGMSSDNIIRFLRNTLFFGLLISLPRLITKPNDFYRFSHLVFPVVFIVLIGEFSQILTSSRLIDRWAGPETNVNFAFAQGSTKQFERPNLYGVLISLYSIVVGLFYYSREDYKGSRSYLTAIIIASFLTAVLFQGRGWISCFALILLLYILLVQRTRRNLIRPMLIATGSLIIAYSIIKPLKIAVDNGFKRYSTVENIAEGDITAGGTNIRYSERLPKVMKGVSLRPVIGLGFSDEYLKYADYHVGFATMLLQIGIAGYIIFIVFWLRFYRVIYRINKKSVLNNPLKVPLLMFSIGLTGILLQHFTSYQFMGFEFMLPPDYFFICIFFTFADNQMKQAMQINHLHLKPDNHHKLL